MRSFLLFVFCFFVLQPAVQAFDGGRCGVSYGECCGRFTDVDFRIAYFYPRSDLFRRIYKGARVDCGLEFTQHPWCHWDIWENVTWLPTSGHSIGESYRTNLDLFTFSAGVKYRFCCGPCNFFHLGLGGVYYNLWIHDKTSCACIKQHRHFQNGGVVVKADYERTFCGCAYWGLFIDYYYLPINKTHGMIRDVGGANFGGLIGYRF
jgi:hypothetical protein